MSTKLYAVTSGCYSDYRVNAIFDDIEIAKLYQKAFRCDDIEEYELNPHTEELKQGYKPYFVRMSKNGDLIDIEECGSCYEPATHLDINNNMYTQCMATSKEHAVKIANERRAMLIASDKWNENHKNPGSYSILP